MEKERYISIDNFIWKMVFAWRSIIIAGIACALVFAGIKYVSDVRAFRILEKESNTTEKLETREEIELLNKEIDQLEAYLSDSIYLNLDATNTYRVYLSFHVKGETAEEAVQRAQMCMDELCTEELYDELVTVSFGEDENEKCRLYVTIIYEDGATIPGTDIEQSSLEEMIIGQVTSDDNIVKISRDRQKYSIATHRNDRAHMKALIADYESEIKDLENQSGQQIQVLSPSFSLKYAILGFAIGVILVCGVIFIRVLFTNKLQKTKEVSDFYQVRVLGSFDDNIQMLLSKKKGIDRLLYSLKYKRILEVKNSIDVIVANVQTMCEKHGYKEVYVTSSVGLSLISQYESYQSMICKLQEKEIKVVEGNNILHDADAFRIMNKCGNVIFVEAVEMSDYREMEAQLINAKDNAVNVLGYIVLE